jgi:hypothetical protein
VPSILRCFLHFDITFDILPGHSVFSLYLLIFLIVVQFRLGDLNQLRINTAHQYIFNLDLGSDRLGQLIRCRSISPYLILALGVRLEWFLLVPCDCGLEVVLEFGHLGQTTLVLGTIALE